MNKAETEKRKTLRARVAGAVPPSPPGLEVELSQVKVHLLLSGYAGGRVRVRLPTAGISSLFEKKRGGAKKRIKRVKKLWILNCWRQRAAAGRALGLGEGRGGR